MCVLVIMIYRYNKAAFLLTLNGASGRRCRHVHRKWVAVAAQIVRTGADSAQCELAQG